MRDFVVVITGASSGIGRDTAMAFARKGCSVVLAARREEALEAVARRCGDQRGHGTLVNVSSVLGVASQPYTHAYGMSKYAVRALGASLRQELRLDGTAGSRTPRTTRGAHRLPCPPCTAPSASPGPLSVW
jgi:short-subunit dehydrogenase